MPVGIYKHIKGKRLNTGKTHFKKGFTPWNKGKSYFQIQGEKNGNWKGGVTKNDKYDSFIERQRQLRKKNNGGFHTLGEWELLKKQYGYTCPSCKKQEPEIKLTEDHIIPLSKGGSNFIENIQPLCRICNSIKGVKIIKVTTD